MHKYSPKTIGMLITIVSLIGSLTASDRKAVSLKTGGSTYSLISPGISVPKLINYQGKLTDGRGSPVPDGEYEVTFSLYTVVEGGTPFWNETQSVETDSGLFNVFLGSSVPIDSLPSNGRCYLGVKVGNNPEMEPRQQIVSVGYSYYADNANKLDGKDDSAFIDTTSDFGRKGVTTNLFEGDSSLKDLYYRRTDADDHTKNEIDAKKLGGKSSDAYIDTTEDYGRPNVTNDLYEGTTKLTDKYFHWGTEIDSSGIGLQLISSNSYGLVGKTGISAGGAAGVYGVNNATSVVGALGHKDFGVYGEWNGIGTYAGYFDGKVKAIYEGSGNVNVIEGETWGNWAAVAGLSHGDGPGLYAKHYISGKPALYVEGDARITGNLSKGSGSFLIDHPLDPENKVLRHSFVESPEMLLIYKGRAKLRNGVVTVKLPDYFDALNHPEGREITLTCINGWSPLYLDGEIKGNRFTVRTTPQGNPEQEFSWVIYGIRNDAYARTHPIVVEEEKGVNNEFCKGKLLHPEAFGKEK